MKIFSGLLILAVSTAFLSTSLAEDYSAFFRYEEGRRIDYSEADPEGKIQNDTITSKAVLHIRIPSGSNTANISLAYGDDGDIRPDDTWEGVVVHRGEEMIAIVCLHTKNDAGEGMEKIENFVIYPTKGVGFMGMFSSRLGMPFLADLSANDKEFPFGSAVVLRLKQLKE